VSTTAVVQAPPRLSCGPITAEQKLSALIENTISISDTPTKVDLRPEITHRSPSSADTSGAKL
jgi:hypothetical protein